MTSDMVFFSFARIMSVNSPTSEMPLSLDGDPAIAVSSLLFITGFLNILTVHVISF